MLDAYNAIISNIPYFDGTVVSKILKVAVDIVHHNITIQHTIKFHGVKIIFEANLFIAIYLLTFLLDKSMKEQ